MTALRLYAHHVAGLRYVEDNVATPFRHRPDGTFEFREPLLAAGVEPVGSLGEADVACFPAGWASYQGAQREQAVAFIEQAADAGRRVAIWVLGDHEVDLPWPNVIQFQHAFRRSRRSLATRCVVPTMLGDFAPDVFGDELGPLPKGSRPLVGFCGQAGASAKEEVKRVLIKARARLLLATRRSEDLPEPWGSHVRLRRSVLAALEADPRVDTDFIIRDRYRGGLPDRKDPALFRHAKNVEFYWNIHRTQYTVCVRGGGNFSVRLYETLCAGRVPLVLDTDGLLPWPDDPFWSEVALVVPFAERHSLTDRLVAHHAAADERGWADRQERARRFWIDRLSRAGWLTQLPGLLAP